MLGVGTCFTFFVLSRGLIIFIQLLVAHAIANVHPSMGEPEVLLVRYPEYIKALSHGRGDLWEAMMTADLVIGGLYLECDWL